MKKILKPVLFALTLTSSSLVLADTYKFTCPYPNQVVYTNNLAVLYSSPTYDTTADLPPHWIGNTVGANSAWSGLILGSNLTAITNVSFSYVELQSDNISCNYKVEGIDTSSKPVSNFSIMYPGVHDYLSYYKLSLSNGSNYSESNDTQIIATDINKNK